MARSKSIDGPCASSTGATTLGATLELYVGDAGPPPDLLVKVALAPGAGEQPALIERIVTPEARDGRLVAEAEFPLERVNSGTYLLRAVVLSGTTTLGTTSATVIRR